jgi:putative acyl-CoA dehydrogenase
MMNVLADLAVESEATTVLMMRLAGTFDRSDDPSESAFRRLGLAVGKFWTCKRAIGVAAEALECHGGNGYVEESILPRLYREAPVNSLWEGSGNINALDVLSEVDQAQGSDARLDRAIADLKRELGQLEDIEVRARTLVERMAVVLEGSLLVRHGDPAVADLFCASRLERGGHTFGTLPPSAKFAEVIERHRPAA